MSVTSNVALGLLVTDSVVLKLPVPLLTLCVCVSSIVTAVLIAMGNCSRLYLMRGG